MFNLLVILGKLCLFLFLLYALSIEDFSNKVVVSLSDYIKVSFDFVESILEINLNDY
jgi:hypothetical protein